MAGWGSRSARGDTPIVKKEELPTAPTVAGLYNVLQDYMGAVADARTLNIAPPDSPTLADLMEYRVRRSPQVEREILRKVNPERLLKGRGDTVKI
jgi:hypothetical protein